MRFAGPRVTCPSCGREVGTYEPALEPDVWRTIRHKTTRPDTLRSKKASSAPECAGGDIPNLSKS